jgi:hypothetical protein
MKKDTAIDQCMSLQGFRVFLALSGYAGFDTMVAAQKHIEHCLVSEKKLECSDWYKDYETVQKSFHLAELTRRELHLLAGPDCDISYKFVVKKEIQLEERSQAHKNALN